MTVDVHTHVIPARALAAARGAGGAFGVREVDGELVYPAGFRAPLTADFHERRALLERMDGSGIEASIVSLSPTMFFYDRGPKEAIGFARETNDDLADFVAGEPRLQAMAQLPLQAPDAAAAELERAVARLGMVGALIGTNVEDTPLDAPALEPVYAAAERLGAPLMLHPYFTGPKPGLEPFYLTNSVGNPLDTCVAAARLIHSGLLDRFPRLDVVLVHGGGFLPYQLGRLDHAFAVRDEPKARIETPPGTYVGRFWFDTLTHSDLATRFLADLVGEDRLLFGTDLPYDMAEPRPLERLRRAGIDADVLARRAADLFRPSGMAASR